MGGGAEGGCAWATGLREGLCVGDGAEGGCARATFGAVASQRDAVFSLRTAASGPPSGPTVVCGAPGTAVEPACLWSLQNATRTCFGSGGSSVVAGIRVRTGDEHSCLRGG